MTRDITMAIGIDFCGFFASSPENKIEHNDIITNFIFHTYLQSPTCKYVRKRRAMKNYPKQMEKPVNNMTS
jgi:hypothetical protein